MIIDKLNDQMFYSFASKKVGTNVLLYKPDLVLERTDNGVELHFYLGGESDDERRFLFQDGKCLYKNPQINIKTKDLSFEWLKYILVNSTELNGQEKQKLVQKYNASIENDIEDYAQNKRKNLISMESVEHLSI